MHVCRWSLQSGRPKTPAVITALLSDVRVGPAMHHAMAMQIKLNSLLLNLNEIRIQKVGGISTSLCVILKSKTALAEKICHTKQKEKAPIRHWRFTYRASILSIRATTDPKSTASQHEKNASQMENLTTHTPVSQCYLLPTGENRCRRDCVWVRLHSHRSYF